MRRSALFCVCVVAMLAVSSHWGREQATPEVAETPMHSFGAVHPRLFRTGTPSSSRSKERFGEFPGMGAP